MYSIKYRGFKIVGKKNEAIVRFDSNTCEDKTVGGIDFFVYDVNDRKHEKCIYSFNLAIGYKLVDYSENSFSDGVRQFVDEHDGMLAEKKEKATKDRKSLQFNKAIKWISENEEGEVLLNILTETFGFTYIDILDAGLPELVPYFNREKYADIIANAIVKEGTENTSTGNWIISFEEIEEDFAVNLKEDENMLELIKKSIYSSYGDAVAGLDVYNNDIDITYYLSYCPYAK